MGEHDAALVSDPRGPARPGAASGLRGVVLDAAFVGVGPRLLRDMHLPEQLFASSGAAHPAGRGERVPAGGSAAQLVAEVARSALARSWRSRRRERFARLTQLPRPGEVIDKYRVEELVGAGGFAVVYRATHLLLHMPVAIKLLRPERLRQHPDLPRMLCTEARNSARINHPRVVRVHDANHTARLTYVVMEYIDGITLGEAVAVKGRLPVRLMLRLGIQVAEGLSAALAAGLVHRDIKPSNILLDRQGDARIVDLGLAQQQAGPGAALDPTTVPQVVGTPGYIAPEAMRRAGAVDHRRDIFSLGVTLYQSLCGTLPFPAAQGIRPGRAPLVPEGPPTAPQALRPELPAALSELLVRMLRPAPEHRPASYELLIDELRALLRAP